MIVADASFLTDLLLNRVPAVTALAELVATQAHAPFHVPELVEPEVLNALRRVLLNGHISEWQAQAALGHLALLRFVRYPHAPLRERVWELKHELSAYDATYLAVAEALGASVLLTSDGRLAAAGGTHLGAGRVRLTL